MCVVRRYCIILLSVALLLTGTPLTGFVGLELPELKLPEFDFVSALFPTAKAASVVKSGDCGDNLTYVIDDTGVLTISGTGKMDNYYHKTFSSKPAPWYSSMSSVATVIIEDGVTSIGEYAFYNCKSNITITIPSTVTSIGTYAFYNLAATSVVNIADIAAWCNIDFASASANPVNCTKQFYLNGVPVTDLVIPESVSAIKQYAFNGCSSLTSVSIPVSVKSIGAYAFYSCGSMKSVYIKDIAAWCNIDFEGDGGHPMHYAENLYLNGELVTELVIPDSAASIKRYAFFKLDTLTSVTIPATVTEIGQYAFYNCKNLSSVSFTANSKLNSIGDDAFRFCVALKDIAIPDSVVSIGERVFSGCNALQSVTMSSGVTSIGIYAFHSCTALTSVYISNIANWCSVDFETKESNPFYCAQNVYLNGEIVTDLTISEPVSKISSYAFYNLTTLKTIKIPAGAESIGDSAFYGCTELKTVTIPASVTSIGNSAFYNCTSLQTVDIPDAATIIDEFAFYNCTSLQSADIGNNVEKIGSYAFCNCQSLVTVSFSKSLKTIGDYAFEDCASLSAVILPDGVANISERAFDGCQSMKTLKLGNSLQYIGKSCFSGCTSLETVTIPDSTTYMGEYAFYSCGSLKTAHIGDGLKELADCVFVGCDLTSVYIGSSVKKMSGIAFYISSVDIGCELNDVYISDLAAWCSISFSSAQANPLYFASNLYINGVLATDIEIPETVTKIKDYAFYGCDSLEYVTIPEGVTAIGGAAFKNCQSLSAIVFPQTLISIGNSAFYNCESLTVVELPDSLATLGSSAFAWCDLLNVVHFGENLTTIPSYAFEDCLLLIDVVIGKNVTTIGSDAFNGCKQLTNITIPVSLTSISTSAFEACPSLSNVFYTGTDEDWEKISVGKYNTKLLNANIHYNSIYPSENGSIDVYTPTEIDTLVLVPYSTENKGSFEFGNPSLDTASIPLKQKLFKVSTHCGEKTFTQKENGQIAVIKERITGDIVLSRENYYDYIIPQEVALSFMTQANTNVHELATYMRKDVKDGKPYVSTVFAKQDAAMAQYVDVCSAKLMIADDAQYMFHITAGNLTGSATYYISQDEAHKIESTSGVFSLSSMHLVLDADKDTYVYFITENGVVSDAVKINLKFSKVSDNTVIRELQEGKLNIGGKNGLSITLPSDWLLVGGATIDLSDWEFPIGMQIEGNKVCVTIGFDVWKTKETVKTSYASIDKETQQEYEILVNTKKQYFGFWDNLKEGVKEEANAFKNSINKVQALNCKRKMLNRYGIDVEDLFNSNVGVSTFDVLALGYIEAYIVNGEFVITDMCLSVAGEFVFTYTAQLAYGYLGLSAGGKVTVSTNWNRVIADLNMPLEFDVRLNVTPALKVRAGVGWDKLLSAGLYGKGLLPVDIAFIEKKLSLSLIGEFGYEAQILIWKTGEQPLLKGTYGPKIIYWGDAAASDFVADTAIEDNGSAGDVFVLTDRVNTSAWWGDIKLVAPQRHRVGISSADELTFKTLQSDVFRLSDAEIVAAGETILAVWVTEAAERDDYNRLKLVYSVYDKISDTWSEPQSVNDDGFMDASPVLASDGEDIYVAWQKYCKTFTADSGADITDVLASAEIFTARYDAEADAFVDVRRLTEDAVYDYCPALTVMEGDAVVVYASNAYNSILTVDGNSITKVEDGMKCSLAENLATVNTLTCAADGSDVQVAYSVDCDGNLKTTDDISVYFGTNSFAEFSVDVSLTNFVFADYNGKKTLFVSDGKNIYYSDNGTIKPIMEADAVISSQLQAVNEKDGPAFYWLAASEAGCELYTCCNIDGEWSNAVCLSERESDFSNLAVTVADGRVIGVANETIISFDEELQMYTSGATNFVFFKENECFDLAMVSVDLDETGLSVGETAYLEIVAENTGNVKADNLTFVVCDSNGMKKEYLVEKELLPGKTILWQIPYVIPEKIAQTTITVIVSSDGMADVDDENNNAMCRFENAALITAAHDVVQLENSYILAAGISNKNFITAESVTVVATFNTPDGEVVSNLNIGNLSKDILVVAEFSFAEEDLVFDENGFAIVYIIAKAENSEDAICSFVIEKSASDFILGDVDGDGVISSSDARMALRAAVGLEVLSEAQAKAADADQDGNVTSSDARLILRCSVGLEMIR